MIKKRQLYILILLATSASISCMMPENQTLLSNTSFINQQEQYWVPRLSRQYNDVVNLINQFNISNIAEIGVAFGTLSKAILEKTTVTKLFSIDPYKHFEPETYQDSLNYTQNQFDILYEKVTILLAPFEQRSTIIRKTSQEAAQDFYANQLDMVYIDANHAYEYVMLDLEIWFDIVRSGGIISGDDYHAPSVRSAVNDFFKNKNIPLNLINNTWYVIKP